MDEQQRAFQERIERLKAKRAMSAPPAQGMGTQSQSDRATVMPAKSDMASADQLAAGAHFMPHRSWRPMSETGDIAPGLHRDAELVLPTSKLVLLLVGMFFGVLSTPLLYFLADLYFVQTDSLSVALSGQQRALAIAAGIMLAGFLLLGLVTFSKGYFGSLVAAALITALALPNLVNNAPDRWLGYMSRSWVATQVSFAQFVEDKAEHRRKVACIRGTALARYCTDYNLGSGVMANLDP